MEMAEAPTASRHGPRPRSSATLRTRSPPAPANHNSGIRWAACSSSRWRIFSEAEYDHPDKWTRRAPELKPPHSRKEDIMQRPVQRQLGRRTPERERDGSDLELDQLLHPAQAFAHPSDVVNDPIITLSE